MLIEGGRRAPVPSGPGKIRCRGSREPNCKLVYWFNSYDRRTGLSTRRVRIARIVPRLVGHCPSAQGALHSEPTIRLSSCIRDLLWSWRCPRESGGARCPAPATRPSRRRDARGPKESAFCWNTLRPLAARPRNISHAQRYAVDRRRRVVLSNDSEDQCTNIPETSASRSCGNRRELGGLAGAAMAAPATHGFPNAERSGPGGGGTGRTIGFTDGAAPSPNDAE
ncbi:hypothetical protein FBZ83_103284 [Azospirillum brasilense]|uniref:Uncharacterized protein n=1 Tax=Azospirillum brasilense TaxID=192 RepID=A0A560CLD6_AZOBR|nr:hypothetical protein FBZ83_103284 [Azospirillum brasilense]